MKEPPKPQKKRVQGTAKEVTATDRPQSRKGSVIKKVLLVVFTIVFVILAAPIIIVLNVMTAAFVFAPLQKPVFVNQNLVFNQKLQIPELLQPRIENGEKVFDLTVQQGETEFFPGMQTKTLGYNGNYLGPTIRAHTGDKIRMNVTNKLPDSTTAHWHGMELPAGMDGGAHQFIKAGENWQPYWTITNQAAPLWYHPHLMGKTGEQVYRGLGGMFIIDDENSDTLDLPKVYGEDDIPLIVQDRLFDDKGQFIYRDDQKDVLGHTGMHGDKILVNGTYAPYVDVPAKQIRLRVLNASNARRYNFAFEDGRKFYQIASDGGLLERPVERTNMILAPAERAEIVIDLTDQTKPLTLMSDVVREENRVLRFIRTVLRSERDENQKFKIIELRPQATAEKSNPLPQKLNDIPRIDASQVVATRKFVLDEGGQSINGKKMDHNRIDQLVYSGGTEIWEFRNQSGVYHPMHIHGVQFQILGWGNVIGGGEQRPPKDYERGWKDTVNVPNAETVRVIMRMPAYSDPHLPYMFHCHILEHEDMGMMGQFIVTDKNIKREDIFVRSKLTESGESENIQQHPH